MKSPLTTLVPLKQSAEDVQMLDLDHWARRAITMAHMVDHRAKQGLPTYLQPYQRYFLGTLYLPDGNALSKSLFDSDQNKSR